MYEITGSGSYKNTVSSNVASMVNNSQYTPGGMIWRDQEWGPARHAMNAAFIASQAAASGINAVANYDFARSQTEYMMGSNPQNQCFIVGFGENCPKKPHHRSSSCPASGDCNYQNAGGNNNAGPNPMVGNQ